MPDCLREFLESLSEQDRNAVWTYLDSNKDCLDKMIEIVAE